MGRARERICSKERVFVEVMSGGKIGGHLNISLFSYDVFRYGRFLPLLTFDPDAFSHE